MGKTNAKEIGSCYYPPRARWYSRFYTPWISARRVLHLEKIHLPGGLSLFQFVLSLVVPGFAFFALGRRMLGRSFLMAYCLAAFAFVAALGYLAGSIGFGLMISAHATSIMFLLARWMVDFQFGAKLITALATLLVVWLLVYAPLVHLAERHWFTPMRIGNQVMIVWRGAKPENLKRGDWVAYEIEGIGAHGVYLRSGFGVDPLLAVAGDRVRFARSAVFVNNNGFPRGPHMATEGEFIVPEHTWFIWPGLSVIRNAAVPEAGITAMMQRVAMVSEDRLIGKVSKHWFGRRQLP